jgi:hypothetical protein
MEVIRWAAFVFGLALIFLTWSSVIRSLIVPRGLSSSLSSAITHTGKKLFIFLANRFETYEAKDKVLAMEAPAILLAQLFTWLMFLVVGFGLMLWPLIDNYFGQAMLESGSSVFTLGFASTHNAGPTVIHFAAAMSGLIVVALQIGYLPTLYGAFNRRETVVTILQSRGGAPAWGPEILTRHQMSGLTGDLSHLYSEWERWSADVVESHTNYPILILFRSPHPLRSWVLGLLAVLDAAALQLALQPAAAPIEARLCLRMGFSCFRHIADYLNIPYDPDPLPSDPIELTFEEFVGGIERMTDFDFPMERTPEEAWPHFKGWRVNYESIAYKLSDLIVAPPGPWSGLRNHLPGMAMVPQRPPNRSPENPQDDRPKLDRFGWHV